MGSKSEINPILLEKSDDLIKAEIQLQRQRLERALREQIEQQRLATKALLQTSEALPNFDLSEVLSRALEIVHPSASAEVASVDTSASDSFDENTFYSSQHDTPEPASPQQSQQNISARGLVSADEPRPSEIHSEKQVQDQDIVMTGASLSNDNYLAAQAHSQVQQLPPQHHSRMMDFQASPLHMGSLGSIIPHKTQDMSKVNDDESKAVRVSTHQQTSSGLASVISQRNVDNSVGQDATNQLVRQAYEENDISPLVRAHNLSPLAPQPARVSPLATARAPPVLLRENIPVDEAHPPQVEALRQQLSGFSSTDSSPKGVKESGKKKAKKEKKKRRRTGGNENATDTESPYIKPEPRSPSPFAVAPLPRPQKRQRQIGQYAAELNYDEPRYEPVEEVQEHIPELYKEIPVNRGYERSEARYEPEVRRLEPSYQRLEREEADYGRGNGGYLPYGVSETRSVRAVSHALPARRVYEEPVYYREPIPRASVRPDADPERSRSPVMRERRSSPPPMAPPRRPVRIYVDEYGREYIDPAPVPTMRQSVAPPRYREPEVIYERAGPRSVSGRAPTDVYEEDMITVPRRVVTQPEYAIPTEYRSYREREYSTRPMPPPGQEFVHIRAPERRPAGPPETEYISRAPSVRPELPRYEEAPREYVRSSTVRPEVKYDGGPREYLRAPSVRPESVRYEIPRDYRQPTLRPEPPLREYAASIRPEAYREAPQREYSVRPVESVPQLGPNGERFYEEIPVQGRNPIEATYIERPRLREASVMAYADEARREVYRY
jgi:hypothetical protein